MSDNKDNPCIDVSSFVESAILLPYQEGLFPAPEMDLVHEPTRLARPASNSHWSQSFTQGLSDLPKHRE